MTPRVDGTRRPARPWAASAFRARRGFTLIELGITVAIVAILATVVLMGRGYMEAARQRNAADLIGRMRGAARLYAQRNNRGLHFGGITLATLQGAGLLPASLTTPWGSSVIAIRPTSSPAACSADLCVEICLAMPGSPSDSVICDDVKTLIPGTAQAVDCTNGNECNLGGGFFKLHAVVR